MLDRLEASGYLLRAFEKEDRRKINIRLTEQALALRDKYILVSDHMTTLFYEGFSEDEILIFEKYLDRILNNLIRKENQL